MTAYLGKIFVEKSCTCGRCEYYQGGWSDAAELRRHRWRLTRKWGWICPECADQVSAVEALGAKAGAQS